LKRPHGFAGAGVLLLGFLAAKKVNHGGIKSLGLFSVQPMARI